MGSEESLLKENRTHKRLTDKTCSNAKPREKPWKLYDKYSGGLYLLVSSSGSKLWRFKYRYVGKQTEIALGRYPEVSLADARKQALDMRQLVAKGQNPVAIRKAERIPKITEATFEQIALDWIERNRSKWSERHTQKVFRRLEMHVFPWLGDRSVDDIKPVDLLPVLRRVEGRGIELAHCVHQYSSAVFRYAIAIGVAETDPAAVLRGALTPVVVRHYAAITEPRTFGELLRAIRGTREVLL